MTRTHTKHRTLADVIRKQIVSGKYKPGAQLPPRTDFERDFRASMPTVQKALDLLSEDGFVRSTQGTGTFVTDHPPHLHHYGVVIPHQPNQSRLYDAMRLAFGSLHPDPNTRVTEYAWDDAMGSRLLQADVLAHRLAGLIIVHAMPSVMHTPAITHPDIPRVFFQNGAIPGLPVIRVDMRQFYKLAIERLVKRGRRRIAVLHVQPRMDVSILNMEYFRSSIARHGLMHKPYWIAPVDQALTGDVIRYVTRVLLELEGEKRPDALIIADENIVEPATGAMMSAGVRVPEDLDVVAHASFPQPNASTLPIDRIGFDCRQMLSEAMRMLDAQRRGKKPADLALPAVTEDELNDRPAGGPAEPEMKAPAGVPSARQKPGKSGIETG